jgi:hypothetical protein
MKVITIEIPDSEWEDFKTYMSETYRYPEEVEDPLDNTLPPIPNPETKEVFMKKIMKQNILGGFVAWKEKQYLTANPITSGINVA